MYSTVSKLAVLMISLFLCIAQAQIPKRISYQGVLTDTAGNPKADGQYSFMFSLYDSVSSPTPIWSETKTINVKSG
ncbi:MAG: hypothetical protein AB1633_11880, partial [Elusimicrobiota bacterium]